MPACSSGEAGLGALAVALVLVVELARHHRPVEAALLVGVLVPIVLAGRWLLRDLRAQPAGFPSPGVVIKS